MNPISLAIIRAIPRIPAVKLERRVRPPAIGALTGLCNNRFRSSVEDIKKARAVIRRGFRPDLSAHGIGAICHGRYIPDECRA
jgi:hypothetical protein